MKKIFAILIILLCAWGDGKDDLKILMRTPRYYIVDAKTAVVSTQFYIPDTEDSLMYLHWRMHVKDLPRIKLDDHVREIFSELGFEEWDEVEPDMFLMSATPTKEMKVQFPTSHKLKSQK